MSQVSKYQRKTAEFYPCIRSCSLNFGQAKGGTKFLPYMAWFGLFLQAHAYYIVVASAGGTCCWLWISLDTTIDRKYCACLAAAVYTYVYIPKASNDDSSTSGKSLLLSYLRAICQDVWERPIMKSLLTTFPCWRTFIFSKLPFLFQRLLLVT